MKPKGVSAKVYPHEDGSARYPELLSRAGVSTSTFTEMPDATNAYGVVRGFEEEQIFRGKAGYADKVTDARGTRRPTRLDPLCDITGASAAELAPVIEVFRHPSRSFLMPPAGTALRPDSPIDISHESLMRVWDRLRVARAVPDITTTRAPAVPVRLGGAWGRGGGAGSSPERMRTANGRTSAFPRARTSFLPAMVISKSPVNTP